ncbi:hypothetical protein [Natrialba asiatica]|uniref:Uncharacterized protein n=1 Tax=Natrialba asiatica (strain ATCC 700177 / DSM 12278 / JCM 9576 / FERM P-10747 / NBRC 102637 / 172P1) TaxID=29540 RepID=M0AGU1_NATA1|nr:hypothetical protein [Natrialba asiatica]ELY97107.1 hypothetical protein C481_20991 [Natrialba asiatica DSM 12278]
MGNSPDAPSQLAELTGEPREKFEFTDEIRDLSEMEPKPIDGDGVDVGFGPFDALAHRHRDRGTDKSEADNE